MRLIQQCLQDDDPNGAILPITLEHLADNGIKHKSDKISLETIKLLPGIYTQEIDVRKGDVLLENEIQIQINFPIVKKLLIAFKTTIEF